MSKWPPKASALRNSHNEQYALQHAGKQVVFTQPPVREGNFAFQRSLCGGKEDLAWLCCSAFGRAMQLLQAACGEPGSPLITSPLCFTAQTSRLCQENVMTPLLHHCHLPLPDFALSSYLSSISRRRKTKARDESRHSKSISLISSLFQQESAFQ